MSAWIKTGDIVRLKSGGPLMTVQVTSGSLAQCACFGEGASCEVLVFELSSLEKLEPGGIGAATTFTEAPDAGTSSSIVETEPAAAQDRAVHGGAAETLPGSCPAPGAARDSR